MATSSSPPFPAATELGTLRRVYGYSLSTRNNRFIFSGIVLAGMFGCVCLTLYGLFDDMQRQGIAPSSDNNLVFLLSCICGAWLLGGLIIFLLVSQWWQVRNFAVGLYEKGLAIRENNGQMRLLPWGEIQSCQAHLTRRRGIYQYALTMRSGEIIILHSNMDNIRELGELIISQINARP